MPAFAWRCHLDRSPRKIKLSGLSISWADASDLLKLRPEICTDELGHQGPQEANSRRLLISCSCLHCQKTWDQQRLRSWRPTLIGQGKECQHMLRLRHRSGILHAPHLPSSQARPSRNSRPSSTLHLVQLETSTRRMVVVHPPGMARSERALWHRSGTARGYHLRCIQAFPSDTSCPSSKVSLAHLGTNRLLMGTQCQSSCPHRKTGIPSACRLRCSLSCPCDSSGPKRPE